MQVIPRPQRHVRARDIGPRHRHRQQVHRAHEAGHKGIGRLVVQRHRRAHLLQHALVQHGHAVGRGHGFFLVVRDEDGRQPQAALHGQQLLAHLHAQRLVQVGQGLVQQQHLRLDHQRARQRHPLLLPARELVGHALAVAGQVHQRQGFVHPAAYLGRRHAPLHQAEGHVVAHAQVRPQCVVLEHHAHLALPGLQRADVAPVDQQLPVLVPRKAGNRPQQGALARTRRPQQGKKLAWRDVQAHALEHCRGAVGEMQVTALDADALHDGDLRAQ